ncbi:DNA repair and recombination protein RAD26 [Astathelohania contejeani]|uniref:DNA repair and recombination protein RAD26 n=1 Tax=Astathelohania contejeani TaxID=164912 RepID=A0ABQ7HZC2_9MICR|nr:DNA repair and recombination protein RAD26 [Thelohania contejeani]
MIDYEDEENFLQKYVEKKIREKIKAIETKLEIEEDEKKRENLKEKIKNLNDELALNLKLIDDMNKSNTENLSITDKNLPVAKKKFDNDNCINKFKKNMKENIKLYAQEKFIKEENFWEHMRQMAYRLVLSCGKVQLIPIQLWNTLYEYQKESLKWMLDLFIDGEGGILADEMGLGKTIQVISLISSLMLTDKIKYALLVSPTTIMDQWCTEWKHFYPFVRICILHNTQTDSIPALINSIYKTGGVAIISYAGFITYLSKLKSIKWDYLILDEGHKIKNKETNIVKKLQCIEIRNKLVLTGTPIQNNLSELWTIFNFINPGKLGSYSSFLEEFEDPIRQGGYKRASDSAVEEGYRANIHLRSIISPYIKRRLKSQVASQLPSKSDKVVFCPLTEIQVKMYEQCIDSDCIFDILQGKRNIFQGIDLLRKICNHPYLTTRNSSYLTEEKIVNSCGKMLVLKKLLKKWKKEGKKAIIFTQTINILNIIEKFLNYQSYKYERIDGSVTLKQRTTAMLNFNTNPEIFIFLATTKTGGLGVNLVGGNRVIIYDPDWNPTTDNQAKERVWRYGQVNDVEIYRFISSNTIEEKIYQKQIFKNVLSKKILLTPKISRFFEKSDIIDLFTYINEKDNTNVIKQSDPICNDKEEYSIIENEKYDVNIIEKNSMLTAKEMINFINKREGRI